MLTYVYTCIYHSTALYRTYYTVLVTQNSSELTAKKGELVRVTNSGLEKKLCIAVKTNGASGTIRKKNLERIDPGENTHTHTHTQTHTHLHTHTHTYIHTHLVSRM